MLYYVYGKVEKPINQPTMKKLYVFQIRKGFGKGWSLPAAILNYENANGKFVTSPDMYCDVLVFTGAKSFNDVSIDILSIGTREGVTRIV